MRVLLLLLIFIYVNAKEHQHSHNHTNLELSSIEESYLKKRVRMCTLPNLLPYSKIEGNEFTGMGADYIEMVEHLLGEEFVLVKTKSFQESLAYVEHKKCDFLPIVENQVSKKKYLNITHSIFTPSIVIATKIDKIFIPDIKEILNQKFLVLQKHAYISHLRKEYPEIILEEVATVKEAMNRLEDDKAYGFIADAASIAYEIQRNYYTSVKISGKVNYDIKTVMAVHSDNKILLSILNKAICHIGDEQAQRIYKRWVNIQYEKMVDYNLIKNLFLIFCIVLCVIWFFMFKQYKLKKEIEQLALNLEKRVQEEVQKNAKKDKQMFAQSRLAQMGEMISMIAHQWRQPLSSIAALAIDIRLKNELGMYKLDEEQGCRAYEMYVLEGMKNIEKLTQSLTNTVDDFRNFYQQNKILKLLMIHEPIEQALSIVEVSLGTQNIQLTKKYNAKNKIEIYDNEIMQVVLNLIKNAEDVFKQKNIESPKIKIETKDITKGVVIEISDNGRGISEDIKEKIFDPYFTTKDEKNGSGLGLYMSKLIIEEHHYGTIRIKNLLDGVCFILEIKENMRK